MISRKNEAPQKEMPTSQVGISENSKRHGNDAMIGQSAAAGLTHVKRWSAFEQRMGYLARANCAVLMLQAEDIKEGEDLANAAINAAMGPDLRILGSGRDVMDILAALQKEATA
jgi:hypothetical protein